MTWTCEQSALPNGRGDQYRLLRGGEPATFRTTIDAWDRDEAFRDFFIDLLAAPPFDAFRWETPAVNQSSVEQSFEFVLLDSQTLERPANLGPFADAFRNTDQTCTAFPNLSGDAMMVVPCPLDEKTSYPHLAAFVKRAPRDQQHAFWQLVGRTMREHLSVRDRWLNTAGAGVAWLHLRIDSSPKYYHHGPYRKPSR